MELNTGALPPPGSAAYSTRHSWPSWRSSSSVRVPGATASPHRLSLTLSLCCARWFRHRAGRCHRAVPEAEAVERLRGVDEPLRTLVFPKLEGARCIALVKGQVARREEAIPCRVHSEPSEVMGCVGSDELEEACSSYQEPFLPPRPSPMLDGVAG
ncbi:unnamed protein product [Durusdinium trenchii]|uniref:Uncharacterized protein n=1 Tax=Durusdinium trenchii TaxID=1381693 RepID=A0ABP0HED2_9DINO